ncbi:GNAT family N-acetyltransferase [Haloimpatiens sp. FM7315]|uniref:GNAT family N-acetyltransferase n=1 Tax=Haloimpatiens sp. FM7315 TaxID=3298609 RepID=UPI0035A2DD02
MITTRMYKNGDYEKIMTFLKEMYHLNKNQHCWLPAKWEYTEHLVNPLYIERGYASWEDYIRIWEEEDKIVAIAHIEDTCNVFLQVRPGYSHLELEMVQWAEDNCAIPVENSENKKIIIWAKESEEHLKELLTEQGYKKWHDCNYMNVQSLDGEYEPKLSEGYVIRSMAEDIDLCKRYNVIRKAFHPEAEYETTIPNCILKMISAPMYRTDLDIVAEYKDGSLAAACIVWYDEQNKIGMFEPVGTHPDHGRKGLGKAILLEGLKRLKKLGATHAYVESYGEERYAFYSSAGFKVYDKDYPWVKTI